MRTWTSLTLLLGLATSANAELNINTAQRLLEHETGHAKISVGTEVDRLAYRDVDGQSYRIDSTSATAFVFLSKSCPLAKRYTQRLNRIQAEFAKHGISVVAVFSNSEDGHDDVTAHAKKMKFDFPAVKDSCAYLARRLGATMTPQAIVVDGQGKICYRGAIDDNRYENRVKFSYLHDALLAIQRGKPVRTSETACLGCTIHFPRVEEIEEVTYTQHVARILQDNCQSCHRPQQVAPFSLTNYAEARTWATEINEYTKSRLMPPWKAAPGFGEFQHEQLLSDEQISLIDRWANNGAPEGPKEALPPLPEFCDRWSLGKPDHVLEMPETYTIGAEGEDDYRHFIIPTQFDRDVFVRATDVIPGNRQTVHHVIAYADTSGKARELDAADPGPGYTRFGDVGFEPASVIGGWAPGTKPAPTPEGTGFWLPKGADVVLQVHYYRTGVEEKDRTRLGLYFCDAPEPIAVQHGVAINHEFTIPPNEQNYKVEASWKVEEDTYAISVLPHMHLLGREMKVTATLPDGRVEPMVWIKDWDFNWQLSYRFRKPLYFPKGTTVDVVSHFDNSSSNPNNPHDPPRSVGWGEKTTDEMCIVFVGVLKADEWQPKSVE